MMLSRSSIRTATACLLAGVGLLAAGLLPVRPAWAQFDPGNDEIAANFIKVAFGIENQGVDANRGLKKWGKPVRIGLLGDQAGRYRAWVDLHVRHLRHIGGFDIEAVARGDVNVIVIFTDSIVDDILGRYRETTRRFFRDEADMERQIGAHRQRTVCYGAVRIRNHEIVGALIVIPPGKDKSTVYQCIVEEITQALGLFADFDDIAYSIFNDKSPFVDLTDQDKLMLKLLADPRLAPGIKADEARPRVRAILDELRPGR